MYAEMWEKDRQAKCRREEMEAAQQLERNRETLKVRQPRDSRRWSMCVHKIWTKISPIGRHIGKVMLAVLPGLLRHNTPLGDLGLDPQFMIPV